LAEQAVGIKQLPHRRRDFVAPHCDRITALFAARAAGNDRFLHLRGVGFAKPVNASPINRTQ
jgi:hypothetical protein